MPTGYTADLCDRDVSFREFVLTCARAFGATVTLRDHPLAPVPERLEPSDYYSKQIDKAHAELKAFEALTPEQVAQRAAIEHVKALAEYHVSVERTLAVRKRLEDMIAKVHAWLPPTSDHANMKTFMLDQLQETLRFDGSTVDLHEPKKMTTDEWKTREVERLANALTYYVEQHSLDIARTNERNAWIKALYESLG